MTFSKLVRVVMLCAMLSAGLLAPAVSQGLSAQDESWRPFYAMRPLDFSPYEADLAALQDLQHVSSRRPVGVSVYARVLQEHRAPDPVVELLRGEETVVATVHLSFPRRPGRGRDHRTADVLAVHPPPAG